MKHFKMQHESLNTQELASQMQPQSKVYWITLTLSLLTHIHKILVRRPSCVGLTSYISGFSFGE